MVSEIMSITAKIVETRHKRKKIKWEIFFIATVGPDLQRIFGWIHKTKPTSQKKWSKEKSNKTLTKKEIKEKTNR